MIGAVLLWRRKELSAPKSRDSLRLRRRFLPLPRKSRFFEAPRCEISSAKKNASEPHFLLRRKWVKVVLAAEFPAIPSSAVKIASEWRCAILVHSGKERVFRLQLQFLSPCYVRINYCNVTSLLYRIYTFQNTICNNFVPNGSVIDLSMGLLRGAVFHHGGVPENCPLALMGVSPP